MKIEICWISVELETDNHISNHSQSLGILKQTLLYALMSRECTTSYNILFMKNVP